MSKSCNKCRRSLDILQFKSLSRKRCIECNEKQNKLNNKTKYVLNEAKKTQLFQEYNFLRKYMLTSIGDIPDYQKGRIKLYSSIIKMIEFDPSFADIKEEMNEEEEEYWKDIDKNIKEAGKLIISNFNSYGEDRNKIDFFFSFIPTCLWKHVEIRWDGLKFKDGGVWEF